MTLKPRSTTDEQPGGEGEKTDAAKTGRKRKTTPTTVQPPPDADTTRDEPRQSRRVIPWGEIRSTYEESALPVSVIAKAYAVRERAVYERASKETWAARRGQAMPLGLDRTLDRSVLVSRLFHAVERQIAEIERRFVELQGTGAGGDERDARTLAALARTIELLIGLERQARPELSDTPETDIDAIRRDLARRIANMQSAEPD